MTATRHGDKSQKNGIIFGVFSVERRKTFGTPSAVRLFVGDVRVTSVALGSSSENIRTSDNLRELFNCFELTKNRLLKIPAEFRISGFPAYR